MSNLWWTSSRHGILARKHMSISRTITVWMQVLVVRPWDGLCGSDPRPHKAYKHNMTAFNFQTYDTRLYMNMRLFETWSFMPMDGESSEFVGRGANSGVRSFFCGTRRNNKRAVRFIFSSNRPWHLGSATTDAAKAPWIRSWNCSMITTTLLDVSWMFAMSKGCIWRVSLITSIHLYTFV